MKQSRSLIAIAAISLIASLSHLCATEIELNERYYSLSDKTEVKKLAHACFSLRGVKKNKKALACFLKGRPTFLPPTQATQLLILKKLHGYYQGPNQNKNTLPKTVGRVSFKNKIALLNFTQALALPK